jgi:hypothetical protein
VVIQMSDPSELERLMDAEGYQRTLAEAEKGS